MPHPSQTDASDVAATALRQIEAVSGRLRALELELERTSRLASLGIFAGAIAHEINNVLTPALSYAQMAQRAPEDSELTQKALDKAVGAIQQATSVAEAILGQARPGEDGEVAANVQDCVERAIACLGSAARKSNVRLRVDVPAGLTAAMAPHSLQQVLLNLIGNAERAIAASEQQGGTITISANCSTWNTPPARGPAVSITVRDDGPGLPESVAARPFDLFASASAEASIPAGEGPRPGLGLAICRRLIESAGGRIEVESSGESGTCFRMQLPAAQ